MGYEQKWNYDDAHQRQKKISSWIIVLNYGTRRGGEIIALQRAKREDVNSAMRLPHVFSVTQDKRYAHRFTASYMDWRNAVSKYNELKNASDIMHLWGETV